MAVNKKSPMVAPASSGTFKSDLITAARIPSAKKSVGGEKILCKITSAVKAAVTSRPCNIVLYRVDFKALKLIVIV
jgi:hypothetical protein